MLLFSKDALYLALINSKGIHNVTEKVLFF